MDSSSELTGPPRTAPASTADTPQSIPMLSVNIEITPGERIFMSFLNQDPHHRARCLTVMPELLDPVPEIRRRALLRMMAMLMRRPMPAWTPATVNPAILAEPSTHAQGNQEAVSNPSSEATTSTARTLVNLDDPEAGELIRSMHEILPVPSEQNYGDNVLGQVHALRAIQRLHTTPFSPVHTRFLQALLNDSAANPPVADPITPFNSPESQQASPAAASLAGSPRRSHADAVNGRPTLTNSYGVRVPPEVRRRLCTVRAIEVMRGDILMYGNLINEGCVVTDSFLEDGWARRPGVNRDGPEPEEMDGGPVIMSGGVRILWAPLREVQREENGGMEVDVDEDDFQDEGYRRNELFEGMRELQVLREVRGFGWD